MHGHCSRRRFVTHKQKIIVFSSLILQLHHTNAAALVFSVAHINFYISNVKVLGGLL
jgi:hypothetical protein